MIRNSRSLDRALSLIMLVAIVMASFPVFPRIAEAADTIFEDGFEDAPAFQQWATSESPWGTNNSDSNTGSKQAQVEGNGSGDAELMATTTTVGYEDIEVSFWYRYEGLDDGDSLTVEYYGTSGWQTLTTFEGADDIGTTTDDVIEWTEWTDALDPDAENFADFSLRFVSSMNTENDKFYLDDVLIEGEEIVVSSTTPVEEYFNGFESDTVDWQDNGSSIVRTTDGTDGVPSQCGGYHAVIDGNVFTRWGGYADEFPTGGYTTEVDVYLDMSLADGNVDDGFDFSSAVNGTDGNHRRDFIFHLETDPTQAGAWLVNASNNVPSNPSGDMDSVQITETGWYTLQSDFHDNGSGVLEVTMNVIKRSDNSLVFTENRSDPSDIIGTTVGGNRYGWFASPRFDLEELAIDNASLYLGEPVERTCAGDVTDTETSETIVVSDDTSAGENLPGWMFNRDPGTATPFVFDTEEVSMPDGSLHVLPIGANASDKFIAENFINTPVADIESISYDFMIGAGGDNTDEEQFYMNVYANFGVSDDLKFYDCRYNIVPTAGSTGDFTTVTFDPTESYTVTTRTGGEASPFTCPASPADMDDLSPGSNVRVFSLNVGDTSASDVDLDGYLDKVVTVIDEGDNVHTTTYNFEPEQTATVEICKFNEDGDRLDGWTLMLLGDHVETVNVPSTGTEVFSTNNLDGDYTFVANGTYIYRPGFTGSTTDAAYSMRTDGNDPIDPTGHPYDPWVRVNDFNSPYEGYLGITVDGDLGTTNWGGIFNPVHEYALQYIGDGDAASFQMVDSSYADNSGSLTVDIYEGYVGVTGEDGCTTFDDVPLGDYEIDEIMQEGWFNVSGLEEVTVDETEETFNVVNTDEEPQPTSTVQICKIDESENALPGWTLMLLGDEVDGLEVPANTMAGVDSSSLEGGMSYLAHVSGTWLNNREPDNHVDAEYSTEDGWVTHMNGFTGYGENILELQIAENFMDWGSYNEDHEYTASFVPGTDGPVNFRIFDGNDPTPEASWYADNSGSLDVTIEEGYVDVTGEDGCVTFEEVPYGDYEIDELMQEGWSNLFGLGEVVVDGEEEVFTVVNQTPLPPQMCSVTVVSDTSNMVEETEDNAVLAWTHSAWTAIIEGADWIWGTYYAEPATTTAEVQTFVKEFEWSGGVASASLVIATDNFYEVYLNGEFVASSTEANLFTDANKDTIPVSGFIDVGENILEIRVTNATGSSNPEHNPAGLKYNLTVVSDETGEDCMFAPEADLEITRPETEDQVLEGEYTFEAEYTDADDDNDEVLWAIRAGTCNSGSGTVAGNVDQFSGASSTPYMWNGASFSSTIDMSDWEEGEYCFVVNPTEDSSGGSFRETRWFTLEHPEPTQCLIVSDTSTLVVENNDFAVETWDQHPNWTHDIADATWIWDSFYVVDPEATTTRTFKETFTVTDLTDATFEIAADNTYSVYINDVLAYQHLNSNNHQTPDVYTDVASYLVEGDNELVVVVTNIGTDDSIPKSNPAGVLFRLEMDVNGQCVSTTEPEDESEPTEYEVFGFAWNDDNENNTKDDESYLPSVTVQITNGTTTTATTTDAGGRYYFMVEPGTWTLSALLSGWNLTYPDTSGNTHEITVVATTSGAHDFGLSADDNDGNGGGGGGGGGSRTGNDDDTHAPLVAGASTTFGTGGGIDIWEDLRNEIGNSGGPFGSVLGATAEAQELDATTTIEVDDEGTTPTEDEEEGASSPWKDWLCDYLWLLPLLWIIASALAYWRKESYGTPAAMFWTQIIFGGLSVILILTYMVTGVPCSWLPSAIVAIGASVMSYFGREA